jgi:seryl-tRNA synthetase
MIDIKFLRENPEVVKENIRKKMEIVVKIRLCNSILKKKKKKKQTKHKKQ